MASRRASPTVPMRRVASTLKMFRERAGKAIGETASALGHNSSWLSRIEGMENRASPDDAAALLRTYGADEAVIEAVREVARQSRQRGWWYPYNDAIPEWFGQYLGLESDASRIRTFEGMAIPGLLQTPVYAREAIMASAEPDRDTVERFLALRVERQRLLEDDDGSPPKLRVVIDESVLWRQVGGPQTMVGQIEHLLEMAERPHVEIQVLPCQAGAHASMNGSFTIMDFPPLPAPFPEADDRLVYVDLLVGAKYFDQPVELQPYEAAWEQLRGDALPADESATRLRRIASHMPERE